MRMLSDQPELNQYYKMMAHNKEVPETERARYLKAIKNDEPNALLKYFEEDVK